MTEAVIVIAAAFALPAVVVWLINPERPWRPSVREVRRVVKVAAGVLTPAADGTVAILDLVDAHTRVVVLLGALAKHPPNVRSDRDRAAYERLLEELETLEVRLGVRLGIRCDGKITRY